MPTVLRGNAGNCSQLLQTGEEVDFTILAATSVFSNLIEKCPPAEACRDAFERTAKATIKMANSTGGFGAPQAAATTAIQLSRKHGSATRRLVRRHEATALPRRPTSRARDTAPGHPRTS